MFQVIEQENSILKQLKVAQEKNSSIRIYIYGCGGTGKGCGIILNRNNIPVEAYLVDGAYYEDNQTVLGIPVKNMDIFMPKLTDIVVVAIDDYNPQRIKELSSYCQVVTGDICSMYWLHYETATDCSKFLEDNQKEFLKFYSNLADEKSKQHMTAFFYQKISGNMMYLQDLWEENEYYDKELVDFSKINTFIDCGAYDGDSYKSFLANYKSNVGKEYEGNALLLEPDEKNYKKLMINFSCTEKVNCLKVGAWHQKDILSFKGEVNMNGTISESGDMKIKVDAIDNLVGDKGAEFIKMDIEGAELNALQGAENTIKKFKPTLAICVYHKKDDLLTIPQYLHSVCPEYKFYLRAHGKYCHNLILYAV